LATTTPTGIDEGQSLRNADHWSSESSACANGAAAPGKVIGPSFAAEEVPDVIEAVIDTYCRERQPGERFIDTSKRLGTAPFRSAADAVRRATAGTAA
jgi:sulfite reductase (NADPH) hemoprotein beta-component